MLSESESHHFCPPIPYCASSSAHDPSTFFPSTRPVARRPAEFDRLCWHLIQHPVPRRPPMRHRPSLIFSPDPDAKLVLLGAAVSFPS